MPGEPPKTKAVSWLNGFLRGMETEASSCRYLLCWWNWKAFSSDLTLRAHPLSAKWPSKRWRPTWSAPAGKKARKFLGKDVVNTTIEGKDACQGDSGGPLMYEGASGQLEVEILSNYEKKSLKLVGLVSLIILSQSSLLAWSAGESDVPELGCQVSMRRWQVSVWLQSLPTHQWPWPWFYKTIKYHEYPVSEFQSWIDSVVSSDFATCPE